MHDSSPLGIFWLLVFLAIYFAPALVAYNREHHNAAPILVLNLFLGWTFVGWVAALVWSLTDNSRARPSDS